MPARDRYHNQLRNALIKDGWTITHDPLRLRWGKKDMYVDLGAEQFIAAEKDTRRIAVEIKTFGGNSEMEDLEKAVGQFTVYNDVLTKIEPNRDLYLAVSDATFEDLFEEPIGQLMLANQRLRLIIFDPQAQEVRRWL